MQPKNCHRKKWMGVEVLFADNRWYHGELQGRVAGTEQQNSRWDPGRPVSGPVERAKMGKRVAGWQPPWWTVHFDDGEVRNDIWLANLRAPVRFNVCAYGSSVEVRVIEKGEWCRGRLVRLDIAGDHWAVSFEDGSWAEDICIGHPDLRYVFKTGGRLRVCDHSADQYWQSPYDSSAIIAAHHKISTTGSSASYPLQYRDLFSVNTAVGYVFEKRGGVCF